MKLFILIFLCFNIFQLSAQYIPDKSFEWVENKNCTYGSGELEVFKVVETPPKVKKASFRQLESKLNALIVDLKLNDDFKSQLKIKVFIPKDSGHCIKAIGVLGNSISLENSTLLFESLKDILSFEPGKQRNTIVNCQGIIYLNIKKGKFNSYRFVNIE